MKLRHAIIRQRLFVAATCFGLAWLLAQLEWVRRVEDITLDFRTRFRAWHQAAPDPRVVVIGIDDDSLQRFGRWQDWPRRNHGLLMHSIAAAPEKPAVVGWDILFPETSPDDEHIVDGALALPGRVIFAAYATEDAPVTTAEPDPLAPDLTQPITRIEGDTTELFSGRHALLPVPAFRSVGLTAFVDTPAGSDGVRRTVPLLVRIKDRVYPSLALQSVLRFWNLTVADIRVKLGDAIYVEGAETKRRIPIDEAGRFLVNYRHIIADYREVGQAPGHAQVAIGFRKKYVDGIEPGVAVPNLGGKIVLIGLVATGLSDNGPTPLSPESPLVFVHANIVENILREDYARPAPGVVVWGAAFLVGLFGLGWFSEKSLREHAQFAIGVPAVFMVGTMAAWSYTSIAIPLVGPLLGFSSLQIFEIVRRVRSEQRKREEIKGMFRAYVSPEVVEQLITSGQPPQLGGHEQDITAYFSDIQGFSAFSERIRPGELVELMNEYLTACTDIVQEEKGTLDKYIGDAVVAMFGAPVALPDHAYRACRVALRVQEKLSELRAKWTAEGDKWPGIVKQMRSRIGLNSGPCIIGNMGSRTRFDYTMMGDNVNLAARMESGAKSWGVYSTCTDATKIACEKHSRDHVVFRALGRIKVMGRVQSVQVFELAGLRGSVPAQVEECIAVFHDALGSYLAHDWARAVEGFERSAALEASHPATGETQGVKFNPSLLYLELSRRYLVTPPGADWDGTYVMTQK